MIDLKKNMVYKKCINIGKLILNFAKVSSIQKKEREGTSEWDK